MAEFSAMEKKWQKKWEEAKIFRATEDYSGAKKKYYVLEMYPYPSGSSLHMGHVRNYTIGDIYARYKRMKGFNVLYPMGYDAFGLPAENAAIKQGIHPREYTEAAIAKIVEQQKALGLSYDWDRQIASCDVSYYKWNQWFFLKFMEKGLAYRKEAPINWCPKCMTVLANEQVEDGKCWRCESEVEIKPLEQWFFRITEYADRLLDDLKLLEGQWPDKIITMQRNWIGRSEGTEIRFKIEGTDKTIPVFTTRIDTIYGVTFVVYAPEHPIVSELVKGTEYENSVREFIKKVVVQDKFARSAEDKEKEGMFIGKYAINPVTNEKIPIYIGNFVLMEYGAGAVMAVPAHDQRDFEFAKKYNIPIKVVINPTSWELNAEKMSEAYIEEGVLVNSGEFDGMNNREAISEIQKYLDTKGIGGKIVQYKLRDWLISRQRYWGTPIPVVYCKKCGMIPVSEKDLPVLLPVDVKFTGKGNPLLTSESFLNVTCPKCGGPARRETDTMDGFMDSCWYFLKFCSQDVNGKEDDTKVPFDKKKVEHWMPVDQYIGGAEHAVMHLLYARFFVKVLKDLGLVEFDEPFLRLFNQGIVYKNGAKMSKSKGNVVTQEEISEKYGIDTARLFLMFLATPDKQIEWEDKRIEGTYKFMNKVISLLEKERIETIDQLTESKMHQAIKDVSSRVKNFEYNLAIISLREYANYLSGLEKVPVEGLKNLILLIAPFTPHTAEEMWENVKGEGFVSTARWPEYDETKISGEAIYLDEFVRRIREDIIELLRILKLERVSHIRMYFAQEWKYKLVDAIIQEMQNNPNPMEIMKTIMANEEFKQHGQDAPRIVQRLLKNKEIPTETVARDKEIEAVKSARKKLEEEFKCTIQILLEEESQETKAKNAMPGKVAMVVEK